MNTKTLLSLSLLIFISNLLQAQISFDSQQNLTTINGNRTVCSADLDGDGDMDIVTADYSAGQLVWYNNTDGQGTFTKTVFFAPGGQPRGVAAGDIDGDGDMDVAEANLAGNYIAWYENNNGDATDWSQYKLSGLASYATFVHLADVDGDTDLDILFASMSDNKVGWYENTDGNGTFSTQIIISSAQSSPRSVFAADIDGDNDLDVAAISYSDNKLVWYENTDGQGSFSAHQITAAFPTGLSVFAADLDGDNDMDLIAGGGNASWFENTDGAGTFGAAQQIGVLLTVWGVSAKDFDKDGDMDVAVASVGSNRTSIYENTDGQGTIGAELSVLSIYNSCCIATADFDTDGYTDIASIGGSGVVAWAANTSAPAITTWQVPGEWNPGIPGSTTDVIIDADYNLAQGFNCNNLTINAGNILTIDNGAEVTVNGLLTNAAGNAGLVIGKTGSLIHMTPGVAGTVVKTIQGGMSTPTTYNWAMIGTPVADFPVQELFSGDYVYSYDPTAGTQNDAWINLVYDDVISIMQGYLVYTDEFKTLYFIGELNEGDTYYATALTGYHLVSNPYPSPVDWAAVQAANGNLAGDYCYWDNLLNKYVSYNGAIGVPDLGLTGLIPVGQAFFVENTAKATPGVDMNNSMRVHPSEYAKRDKAKAITNRLRLSITNGEQSDELAIYFASEGSDMQKFFSLNEEPQLYAGNHDNALVIDQNTPLSANENRSIALGLQTFANETLTISAFDFDEINPAIALYLEDTETGQFIDLRSKASYTFAATEGTFDNRFILHVTNSTTDVERVTEPVVNIYSHAEKAYINTNGETAQSVEVYTLSGQLIHADFSSFAGIRTFEVPVIGVYIIKVQTESGVTTERVVIN